MKKAIILFGLAAGLVFAVSSGCGDKGTESNLSKLVGTWWYASATLDDVPYDSYESYSGNLGDTMYISFKDDLTWNSVVLDVSIYPVHNEDGSYVMKGDSLIVTTSGVDQTPISEPIVEGYTYAFDENRLTLTRLDSISTSVSVLVVTYIRDPRY